ncbi:hypothetical protein GW916_04040 [bacterium]|nr:hypothetical protein [bacterium]
MRNGILATIRTLTAGGLMCCALISSTVGADDGAESNDKKLMVELPAQGRAFLTAEDLQTLLGIRSRDPSSQEAEQSQEVTVAAPSFYFDLNEREKAQVAKVINKVRVERSQLEKDLQQQSKTQKESLRSQRKNIQMSRIKTGEAGHQKLGRDLFASLLAEANAEAGVETALKKFDEKHRIEIQFIIQEDGQKAIAAIKLGRDLVWADRDLQNEFVAGL